MLLVRTLVRFRSCELQEQLVSHKNADFMLLNTTGGTGRKKPYSDKILIFSARGSLFLGKVLLIITKWSAT